MRIAPIVLALVCAACSSDSFAPPENIAGSWSNEATITPAGPLVLVLTESHHAVSGYANWAAQHYSVSGQYVQPDVTLSLVPEFGGNRVSSGSLNFDGVAVTGDIMVLSGTTFHRVPSRPSVDGERNALR